MDRPEGPRFASTLGAHEALSEKVRRGSLGLFRGAPPARWSRALRFTLAPSGRLHRTEGAYRQNDGTTGKEDGIVESCPRGGTKPTRRERDVAQANVSSRARSRSESGMPQCIETISCERRNQTRAVEHTRLKICNRIRFHQGTQSLLTGWVPLSKMAPSSTAVTPAGTEGSRLKKAAPR